MKLHTFNGEKISKSDEDKVRRQFYDILKGVGIMIPFVMIPGSSVLLPFMIYLSKKWNIEIFPSSFNSEKKKQNS